jgi:hypothetical protein
MMADLILQVPFQLLLVDWLVGVEGDIGCARPWMSPLGQGRRDVFLLGGEGAFADTPFVEPSSILRLSAQQDQIQSVSMEVWSIFPQ